MHLCNILRKGWPEGRLPSVNKSRTKLYLTMSTQNSKGFKVFTFQATLFSK